MEVWGVGPEGKEAPLDDCMNELWREEQAKGVQGT